MSPFFKLGGASLNVRQNGQRSSIIIKGVSIRLRIFFQRIAFLGSERCELVGFGSRFVRCFCYFERGICS